MYFKPFGPDVPHYVYFVIVAVATMFGAWEGGLTGIATENKNLRKFHHDIEAGKYLILIYARKEQGATVRIADARQASGSGIRRGQQAFRQPVPTRQAAASRAAWQ